ncbi:acyl-[acyl-carrier-protein] thioesterase [Desulfoplanes formicivorans]|uniref:Acyl-ACP thioesterase n=1 Tax=Desulfoplanes formicivorans TaxID=1592317 RepID=A0A194AEW7_9BACT|nr:acyl-ACP thioesterase domain-containing protein [Desulfoplanes formicivorans]GAU07873.1 acyl-ACP thioesterase [Desulfoplanes formicivorans]
MDSTDHPTFSTPFYPVRIYETDPGGKATIITLINYFQEAAAQHSRQLGFHPDKLREFGVGWVMSRLSIQVQRYPEAEEMIRVTTWPRSPRHKTAFRDFILEDAKGGILARGTSAWPVMDLETRTMTDLPPLLAQMLPHQGATALEFPSRTVPKLKDPAYRVSHTPDFFHLDMNGHVNNVHFVTWALEAMPWEFRRTHELTMLDIVFRGEIRQDDVITADCAPAENNPQSWLHSLSRKADCMETARALSKWRQPAP